MTDDRKNGAATARWPAGLRAMLSVVVLLGLISALPWLGIFYCMFAGHTACPAILSPQPVQVSDRTEPVDARARDSAAPPPSSPTGGPTPVSFIPGNRPDANPKFVALVIGNSNYEKPNKSLKNPMSDAIKIAETLKDLNYTLIGGGPKLDLGLKGMRQAILEFRLAAADAEIAVVYYAGHGIQIDDNSPIFMIPLDAKLEVKEALEGEAVDLLSVTGALPGGINSEGREQYGVVIFDACRTSNYPMTNLKTGRGPGLRGIKAVKAPNRVLIAYSASSGEAASDGAEDETNSPYARSLLVHMQAKDDPDVKTIFDRVEDDFRKNGEAQNPGKDDKLGDRKFSLAAPQKPPPVWTKRRDCKECPEIVILPGGKFRMGAPTTEAGSFDNERPLRNIAIANPFGISTHEITFNDWDACVAAGGCKYKPSDEGWGRGDLPVINVNWKDTQAYVTWLSRRTHNKYRLLSEAEWEYAARAGSTTTYPWGDTANGNFANYDNESGVVSGRDKWISEPAPVGRFPPNKSGLFDMHGNVWEWVQDCYGPYDARKLNGGAVEDDACETRVLRGGSWIVRPRYLRSAFRVGADPSIRGRVSGFRVARTL